MTLACGHDPSPHSEYSTGTAHLPDGREVCWECADTIQRDAMVSETKLLAYLNSDGTALQTWSGGILARVTSNVAHKVGFHGSTRHYLTAIDPTGKKWHGTSPGTGMYAKMRASK